MRIKVEIYGLMMHIWKKKLVVRPKYDEEHIEDQNIGNLGINLEISPTNPSN